MPTTMFLYPHTLSKSIGLRVVDPYDPTQENVDFGRWFRIEERDAIELAIDLSREDVPSWRSLRMTLEATIPSEEFNKILPSTSNHREDTLLFVSVQCPATKFRQAFELAPSGEGLWRGEVVLRRMDLRNTVHLRPRLVRRTDNPAGTGEDSTSVARHRGLVIGEGGDLALVIDESRKPIGGALRMEWEDFRGSRNPWRRDHADDIFHLEPYGSDPTLWLNSFYEKLRAALYSRTAYGADAAVRHLANALLAQTAWVQLFVASLGSAATDETLETTEPPDEGWKRGVIAKFLPRLFPEVPDTDRLGRGLDQLRSPEQVGSLMSMVGTAAQEVMAAYKLVEKAIRAAERSKEES